MKSLTLALLLSLATMGLPNSANAFEISGVLGMRSNSAATEGLASGVSFSGGNTLHYGAYLTFSFVAVGFRTGLLMVDRTLTAKTSVAEIKYKLNYFEVPAHLMVYLPLTGLYLYGGASLDAKTSFSCDVTGGGTATCDIPGTNLIANFGVGYDIIDLTVAAVGVEAQYDHGLTNLNPDPSNGSAKIYSRGYAVNAFARFGF